MLNKKILAVAIVGSLATGNALAAADLSAPNGAIPAVFAKEIVVPAAGRQLTTSVPAGQLTWNIGYNFSQNEVRYARLECSDNIKFGAGTAITLSDPTAGNVGSVNGLNTNTVTFSITSVGGPANNVIGTDTLLVSGNHTITSTASDVTCSVALYDQPSQAQAGGTTGLIANTYFNGAYLSFAQSYELVANATTHIANVEAVPSFSSFLADAYTTTSIASLGKGAATTGAIAYRLKDPAGPQATTLAIDGTPVTLPLLLDTDTTVVVAGDYALAASTGSTPYDGAAEGRVRLNSQPADDLTSSSATFNVGNTGFTGQVFSLERRAGVLIPAADYTATLKAVSATPADYAVTDITGVKFGSIVRNGTELQAPLVQIPGGWTARVVLTNTGGTDRPYSLKIQTETGATFVLDPAKLSGTVPANSTVVIQFTDADLGANSGRRGTVVANVAGPTGQIQGLYQIVNPNNGLVNNHVMVRPGTN